LKLFVVDCGTRVDKTLLSIENQCAKYDSVQSKLRLPQSTKIFGSGEAIYILGLNLGAQAHHLGYAL
jgi:hypothetical protein